MDLLEQKITVNKNAYQLMTGEIMSDSLSDAYNQYLSKFVGRKQDPNYNDVAHQYLVAEDGKLYYFDSFKYLFPADKNADEMEVLNNNVGQGKLNTVEYTGTAIIAQNWDFNTQSVNVSSYFITDETRKYINEKYGEKMGHFLLQVSGGQLEAIGKLEKGQTIQIRRQNEKLISMDTQGNIIDEQALTVGSFYNQVKTNINYYALLDNQYSKEPKM